MFIYYLYVLLYNLYTFIHKYLDINFASIYSKRVTI